MATAWQRYLVVGMLAVGVDLLLPVGLGRDGVYCLVAASGAGAVAASVRWNRPDHPRAWHLLAAGMASWVLGIALRSWHTHTSGGEWFPSLADVAFLAAYPLITGALLLFARSRGRERWPTAVLDSAIMTIAAGMIAWVFLIQPIWVAPGQSTLTRLVAIVYPVANVLLLGAFVRLANAPGPGRIVSRVLAGSIGAMLIAQGLTRAMASVPVLDVHSSEIDSVWLVVFVLAGAAALHPSTRVLSSPAADTEDAMHVGRVVVLAAVTMTGPGILVKELIAGDPLQAWTVILASALLMLLILARMVRLVRQLQAQAQRVIQLADTDHLTGLANRRALYGQAEERLSDPGRSLALLLLDLDRFKEVNDSLGHHVGDLLLVETGARLRQHLQTGDMVARLGGDEFAVLLENAGPEQATALAGTLSAALSETFALDGIEVHTAVSIGIAVVSGRRFRPEHADAQGRHRDVRRQGLRWRRPRLRT